jgi:hypothetical protein
MYIYILKRSVLDCSKATPGKIVEWVMIETRVDSIQTHNPIRMIMFLPNVRSNCNKLLLLSNML